jgi:hypothetical protein
VVEYNPPNIRSGAFLPSATADRMTGNLYVVYQASIGGAPRILSTKSSDEGRTWTVPVPITDNRLNTAVLSCDFSFCGRTNTQRRILRQSS